MAYSPSSSEHELRRRIAVPEYLCLAVGSVSDCFTASTSATALGETVMPRFKINAVSSPDEDSGKSKRRFDESLENMFDGSEYDRLFLLDTVDELAAVTTAINAEASMVLECWRREELTRGWLFVSKFEFAAVTGTRGIDEATELASHVFVAALLDACS